MKLSFLFIQCWFAELLNCTAGIWQENCHDYSVRSFEALKKECTKKGTDFEYL